MAKDEMMRVHVQGISKSNLKSLRQKETFRYSIILLELQLSAARYPVALSAFHTQKRLSKSYPPSVKPVRRWQMLNSQKNLTSLIPKIRTLSKFNPGHQHQHQHQHAVGGTPGGVLEARTGGAPVELGVGVSITLTVGLPERLSLELLLPERLLR